MGFRSTLENCPVALSDSEQRIGEILLTASYDALVLTAAQVAERANVHESTVVRFAQKLGYSGYPGLRSDLLIDVQETRVKRVEQAQRKSAAYQHRLATLIDAQIATLNEIREHITQASLDAAAKVIASAQRVFLFGHGFMTPAVEFMERKLRRYGDVIAIKHDGTELTEKLASFTAADALVVFEFSEQYRAVSVELFADASRQARGVLLTDHPSLMLRPLPRNVIAMPRGREEAVMAEVILVCYALSYALAHIKSPLAKPSRRAGALPTSGVRPPIASNDT